ncbi:MAG: LrgB family protein [Chloroflexi bacterium]|nr:LrgB family protein [Chloroflexota bacterium]
MTGGLADLWGYLSSAPLLWLAVTVAVYELAVFLYERANLFALLNPVLVAVILIIALLLLTNTPYDTYFEGVQFIHFLLGPATVSLAVPAYEHVAQLRRVLVPLLITLLIGSLTGILTAVGIGWLLGLSRITLLSLFPKSATIAIAVEISETIGGLPPLTAVLVIVTGISGAAMAGALLNLLRIREEAARGFAIGVASHGIGTTRALHLSNEAGAFSGLALVLNGVLTALLAPLLVALLGLG